MPKINPPDFDYSKIKKVVWRFVRVFIAGFFVTFGSRLMEVQEIPSLLEIKEAFLIPACIAGLVSIGKALREYFADGDYENRLHKLPI